VFFAFITADEDSKRHCIRQGTVCDTLEVCWSL